MRLQICSLNSTCGGWSPELAYRRAIVSRRKFLGASVTHTRSAASKAIFRVRRSLIASPIAIYEFSSDDFELLESVGDLATEQIDTTSSRLLAVQYLQQQQGENDKNQQTQPSGEQSSGPCVSVYYGQLRYRTDPTSAPPTVILKEYPPEISAMASRELEIHVRLQQGVDSNLYMYANTEAQALFSADPGPPPRLPFLVLIGFFKTFSMDAESAQNTLTAGPSVPLPKRQTPRESTWLVFEGVPLSPAAFFPSANQQQAIFPITTAETRMKQRAQFIKAVMLAGLEAVSDCHSRGIAHGSLNPACILLSTYDQKQPGPIGVKLSSFARGTDISPDGILSLPEDKISLCRSLGASTILDMAGILRKLDWQLLGFSFVELILHSLGRDGAFLAMEFSSIRRLWGGVFQYDVEKIRLYYTEDKDAQSVVDFLDGKEKAGWDVLGTLLNDPGRSEELKFSKFWDG